jgi:diguanylate cyclase (GGDEF)-like protein
VTRRRCALSTGRPPSGRSSTTPAAGSGDTAPDEIAILGAGGSDGADGADGSWLLVSLRSEEAGVAAVVLTSARADAFTPADLQLAAALAGEGMVAYEKARLFTQVQLMATTDALTGVANRRHFFALAQRDVGQPADPGPFGAVMIDIDWFKCINDEHGHHTGDQIIAGVADRLRAALRVEDRLCRYGGEEFAVILPAPTPPLSEVCERLRRAVADRPFEIGGADETGSSGGARLSVTISVGGCPFDPATTTLAAALSRADTALYEAKNNGRDAAVLADASTGG